MRIDFTSGTFRISGVLMLAIVVFLSACRQNTKEESSPIHKKRHIKIPTLSYTKRYTGTIGADPLVMYLNFSKYDISGYYFVSFYPKPVQLYSDFSPITTVTLTEIGGSHHPKKSGHAKWVLETFGDSLIGTWTNGKRDLKLPVNVRWDSKTTDDCFQVFNDTFEYHYFPTRKIPYVTYEAQWLEAPKNWNGGMRAFVKRELLTLMGCSPHSSWMSCVKSDIGVYFNQYTRTLSQSDAVSGDSTQDWLYNLQYHKQLEPYYFEKNWLSFRLNKWELSGGAHGIWAARFRNLDLQNQRVWELQDVLDTMQAGISDLLTKQAKIDFGVDPSYDLGVRLLVESIPLTSNFFITDSGLGFVYNPYEISSYADGEIIIFLPYIELKPYLKPDFLERIGEQNI